MDGMLNPAKIVLLLLTVTAAHAQFTAVTGSPFAVGSMPRAAAVGDFNGDGKADIVTANSASNNITVLLSNGSGGFSAPWAVHSRWEPIRKRWPQGTSTATATRIW